MDWETVAVDWEIVAVDWQPVAVDWEIVAACWETVPACWQTVAAGWETVPAGWFAASPQSILHSQFSILKLMRPARVLSNKLRENPPVICYCFRRHDGFAQFRAARHALCVGAKPLAHLAARRILANVRRKQFQLA